MGLQIKDQTRHTYRDYLTWPEGERYELINGQAYAMAPAPRRIHQEITGEIFRQIANALKDSRCRVYIAPFDVRLPTEREADEAIDTVVQPDIPVICDPARLDERGCRGAPDWIIEVLSPATAAHDQIIKRDLYERHGVREYWLVHPTDRLVMVYCHQGGSYGKPAVHKLEDHLAAAILPEITIAWDRKHSQ